LFVRKGSKETRWNLQFQSSQRIWNMKEDVAQNPRKSVIIITSWVIMSVFLLLLDFCLISQVNIFRNLRVTQKLKFLSLEEKRSGTFIQCIWYWNEEKNVKNVCMDMEVRRDLTF
jgi:hypothetical protein